MLIPFSLQINGVATRYKPLFPKITCSIPARAVVFAKSYPFRRGNDGWHYHAEAITNGMETVVHFYSGSDNPRVLSESNMQGMATVIDEKAG